MRGQLQFRVHAGLWAARGSPPEMYVATVTSTTSSLREVQALLGVQKVGTRGQAYWALY
jgi:hypothetical protein